MTFFTRHFDRIKTQSVVVLLFLAITGARAPAEIIPAADDAGHPFSPHFWGTNGVDIYSRNPGNVGIGTTEPIAQLDVRHLNTVSGIITRNASNSDSPLFQLTSTSNHARFLMFDSAGNFAVELNGVGGTSYFNTGGNVGIGTTDPSNELEVIGFIAIDTNFGGYRLQGESGSIRDVLRYGDFPGIIGGTALAIANGEDEGDILFHTSSGGGALNEVQRMMIDGTTGNVGIGTSTPNEKLQVIGNVRADAFLLSSDARFKKDVEPMAGSLSRLLELRGVEFDWKRDEFPDYRFSDQRQIGFIAQEVLNVLPSVVSEGSDGSYAVDYGRITPVLVEAIKELHQTVEDRNVLIAAQGEQIEDLMARLDRMEMMMASLPDVEIRGAE